MTPFMEKNYNNTKTTLITEEQFFDFFLSKKLKLTVAFFAGFIGVIGNYYAVKMQIMHMRGDMIGESLSTIYALGFTGMLDLAIILFSLMNVPLLAWLSTIASFIIALYSNITMMLQTAGGTSFSKFIKTLNDPNAFLQFSFGITIAILPVFILKYLMLKIISENNKG